MIGASLLLLAVAAIGAPAARANQLAQRKAWDELLLEFATVKPSTVSPADAAHVAQAFTQGCLALERDDAILAFDLGKHAAAFKPIPEGLLCWARTARKTDQRQSAEEALRIGMNRYPRDARFALELGHDLLDEGDAAGALRTLETIPARSPQAAEARPLLQRARALTEKALADRQGGPPAGRGGPPGRGLALAGTATAPLATGPDTVGFESGVGPGDIRTRSNRYFHFKYFNNRRDFGQRAEFEGQVAAALDAARIHTSSVFGTSRESPVDVILYTREEFALHHGEAAARSIAGLYSQNAIRVNAALELTPEHRATLTHEYVHAVVDELAGGRSQRVPTWMNEGIAEYLEWRFMGLEDAPRAVKGRLRAAARQGGLPSLTALNSGALIGRADPGLMYAYSAVAARILFRESGGAAYARALTALGQGTPVEEVFRAHFSTSPQALDQNLAAELAGQ